MGEPIPSHPPVLEEAKPSASKGILCLAAAVVALLLGACTQQPPLPASFDGAPYRSFLIDRALLPFRAEGSALLTLAGERETGDLELRGTTGPLYNIRLKARLTGSLAVEVRFDNQRLMVVDYVNERYFQGDNNEDARRKLFSLDLESEDLQTLVTGRVERERFERGGGWRQGMRTGFTQGAVRHTFVLDEWGLPLRWTKFREEGEVFQVHFREYFDLPTAPGKPPLRLPRKVRLIAPDGGLLVLGLRAFIPETTSGAVPASGANALPSPDDLPAGARDFAPDLLGRLP